MKTVTAFFLMLTTIMVTTALAAPVLDMYLLTEGDCRVCHADTGVLKMTDHAPSHTEKTCSNCHDEKGSKSLNCMKDGCHNSPDDEIPGRGVTNHHDFDEMGIDDDCFLCHEQGVPRGGK
jgi:hypothetical protein